MYNYPYKARVVASDKWHVFTLSDIPVPVTGTTFALMNVPNSPLLSWGTVRCGMDSVSVFEGDIIRLSGVIYKVHRHSDFSFEDAITGRFHYTLNNLEDFCLLGTFSIPASHPRFKYKDVIFTMSNICGIHSESALFIDKLKTPVPVADVQQDTRLRLPSGALFFGDTYEGEVVEMRNGSVMAGENSITRKIRRSMK